MVDHNFLLLDPSSDFVLPLAGILTKRHAAEFVPRIGGGDQSESLLDSLKTSTVEGFGAGMFQRRWKEKNKVARSVGIYNENDDTLYPVPDYKSISGTNTATGSDGEFTAKLTHGNYLYFGFRANSKNYMNRINCTSTPAFAGIAYPAAVRDSARKVSTIEDFSNGNARIHVVGQIRSAGTATSVNHHRLDPVTGAWSADLGGGLSTLFTYNNQLYGANETGYLYIITNPNGTHLYKTLDMFYSPDDLGSPNVLGSTVYNGAAYVFTIHGLFRFDGVAIRLVTEYLDIQMHEHNGVLYGVKNGWLVSFDGTNIKRVQRFFETGDVIRDITSAGDYLAILTSPNTNTKFVGSDSSGTPTARVYLYDGVGFSLLHEGSHSSDMQAIAYANGYLVCGFAASNVNATSFIYFDMNKFFTSVSTSHTAFWFLEAVTSDHDGDYPKILKSYESVDVEFDNLDDNDTVNVYFSYKVDGTWQDFEELTDFRYGRWQIPYDRSKKIVESIKVKAKVTPVNGSSVSMRSISIYYTLQPRRRFQWSIRTDNGLDTNIVEIESGNSTEEMSVNERYSLIDKALSEKMPLVFLPNDKSTMYASHVATDTTLEVNGILPLSNTQSNEPKLIAVKNDAGIWEIMYIETLSYDSGTTQVEVKERGSFGITAGTFSVGNEVRLAYHVTVDQLQAELSDNAEFSTQESDGITQQIRSISFDLVEV